MDAIGGHDQLRPPPPAPCHLHLWQSAGMNRGNLRVGLKTDVGALRGLTQKINQIGPVKEVVALVIRQPGQIQPGHLRAFCVVAKAHRLPPHGTSGFQPMFQPKRAQHGKAVGADL